MHADTPVQLVQDPLYPTFTDDGQAPVIFDWPIATANSSGAFPNVNYSLIQSQMAQFFPNTVRRASLRASQTQTRMPSASSTRCASDIVMFACVCWEVSLRLP